MRDRPLLDPDLVGELESGQVQGDRISRNLSRVALSGGDPDTSSIWMSLISPSVVGADPYTCSHHANT